MMPGAPGVDELLDGWMPEQRWFGGKGRAIARVRSTAELVQDGDPALWVYLVDVGYNDGGQHTYFVPLTFRAHTNESLTHGLIGEVTAPDGTHLWVHDALRDRDATTLWTRLLAAGTTVGSLRFVREPGADIPVDTPGDTLTAEQSNTSLVFGESTIAKFFRRLEPGLNPDVEVHDALRSTDNPHIAALLGYITVDLPGAEPATAAMAQTFLPVASDGWSLALTSVRDLYAEGDLHPDEVGGDFAAESHRLGAATASVHADLAQVLPTGNAGRAWLTETATAMRSRLAEACQVVPDLLEHAAALEAVYDGLAEVSGDHALQRVHGDLHLGQVLRTAQGWTILDFEGEPAKPITERRTVDTPLRDVAGMLRSFDYAARSLLLDGQEDPQLAYRATEWANRNRAAFCEGYGEASGSDPRDAGVLLTAFEADKAVYEAVYEARNRPGWLTVPLRSLDRITAEERS